MTGVARQLPQVSESRLLLGSGLRPSKAGLSSHKCIQKFDTAVSAGLLEIGIELVDDEFRSDAPGLMDFINSGREQIEHHFHMKVQRSSTGFKRQLSKPSLYLVSVKEKGQLLEIDESSVEYAPWVWEVVKKGGLSAFFEACGTKVVSALTLESTAYALFGYFWDTRSEAEEAHTLTRKFFKGDSSYSSRIALFEHDLFDRIPFLSIYADVGRNSGYDGLPFDLRKPKFVVDHFANSVHHSGHGILQGFRTTYWRDFADGRYLIPRDDARTGEFRVPEQTWMKENQFRSWLYDFWSKERFLKELESTGPTRNDGYISSCRSMLEEVKDDVTIEQWKRCEAMIESGKGQMVSAKGICGPFVELGPILESPACTQVDALERGWSDKLYGVNLENSLQLTVNPVVHYQVPVLNTYGLYSDDSTFVNVPDGLKLGTGMNIDGDLASTHCIVEPDDDSVSASSSLDSMIPSWLSGLFTPSGPEAWSQTAWDGLDYSALRESDKEQKNKGKDKAQNGSVTSREGGIASQSNVSDESSDTVSQLVSSNSLGESAGKGDSARSQKTQNRRPPIDIDKVMANERLGKLSHDFSSAFSDTNATAGAESILSLKAIESVYGTRKWAWWRPFVFFWRSAPRERVIHRTLYEYRGATPLLASNFELTDQAKKLAKEDIKGFFKECGTHYVRRIIHRRGVVFYYTAGSPGDREIAIVPFGLSQRTLANPIFSSKTVREFRDQVDQLRRVMEDSGEAIPERVDLEPWVNYLRFRGLIDSVDVDLD